MNKKILALSLGLFGLTTTQAYAAPILENTSFEVSSVTSFSGMNAFQYAGVVNAAPWSFTGLSGISENDTAWFGVASSGGYFAFLQQDSSVSQTFFSNGNYNLSISFDLVDRPFYPADQNVQIWVDSILQTTIDPTAFWATYTVDNLIVGAGSHTLEFRGIYTAADASSFLDNIQMTAVNVSEPALLSLLAIGLFGFARRRAA
ncbi:hypothetical protein CKO12_09175 [Chromatium okenii]|nr:hypothetical protein [Chromatium okenii]